MSKIKSGAKIVFVKDCRIVGDYKTGDKAIVNHICNEGTAGEHYEITLSSGQITWAEEHDFRVVKKWVKATEENIAELKVGDKVKLRSGVKAKIIEQRGALSGEYPIAHDSGGDGNFAYMACKKNGKNCLGEDCSDRDIVKVRNKEYDT